MVSAEQNELLVRVGRGKSGGEMFRRYWQPALLSREVEENDGPPVRVRLLGEDLIAFRDSNGRVGLVDAYCAHRRAPLFFGRNEECGIRCVYHGWKFDVNGVCMDLPSEPMDSDFKSKVRLTAYPTVDRGGIIWAYLGPKEHMPAPPDFEWLRAPATHRYVSKTLERANYLQGLEGGLDTVHGSFLHYNQIGDKGLLRQKDRTPRIEIETKDYGYIYASLRNAQSDRLYVRIYHYVLPNHQLRANIMAFHGEGRWSVPKLEGHTWVPIDDENTWVYNWSCGFDQSVELTSEYMEAWEARNGRGKDDLIPGTFELKQNKANDYLIDRAIQRRETFTGIKGVNTQDFAVQEGMGPIVDRSKEFLGSSDRAIVTMRRLLLENIRAVQQGERLPSADAAAYRHVRPYDDFVPRGADWKQTFAADIVAKW